MLRLAGVTSKTDPVRAGLLKQAFGQSKEKQIAQQFREIEQLLAEKKYGAALARQKTLRADLMALLNLLQSEDRDKKIDSEKRRIREYLERLAKILKAAGRDRREHRSRRRREAVRRSASPTPPIKTEKLHGDIRKQEESAAKEGEPGQSSENPSPSSRPPAVKPPEPGDGGQPAEKCRRTGQTGRKPVAEIGTTAIPTESIEPSGVPSAQKRLAEAAAKDARGARRSWTRPNAPTPCPRPAGRDRRTEASPGRAGKNPSPDA